MNEYNTEYKIQDFTHRLFTGRLYDVPNVYLYRWESDFISVTKSGYVHEFEIKCSKSDFKNDAKHKAERHGILQNGHRNPAKWERYYIDNGSNMYKLTKDGNIICNRPNYFWFICPDGLITEVPEYAGLMYATHLNFIIKKAPKLHGNKISQGQLIKLVSSMYHRYWQIRYDLNRK